MHDIRDAIFAGEYLPGQRLLEEDLAASLQVSRNVVREAFCQLEAQGLVQSDDYCGRSIPSLSVADMAELIPLRLALESLAAAWAARHITPEAAQAMRKQVTQFSAELGSFSAYAEIDFEFHEMIWRLAGNRHMVLMLERLAGPMIALQARVYQPLLADLIRKETDNSEGSHRRIVEAICTGAPARARRAMQKHILAFWQMWLKQASGDEGAGRENSREAINDAIGLLRSLTFTLHSPMHSRVQAERGGDQ